MIDLDEMKRDMEAGTKGRFCMECGLAVKRKGQKFCSHKCKGAARGRKLRKQEMWRLPNARGYIEGTVWLSDGTQRRVRQHRYIMEQHIGRALHPWEDVHHVNGVRHDNRIENLMVIDHGKHTKHHNLNREYTTGTKYKLTEADRDRRIAQCAMMRDRKKQMGLCK